MKTQNADAKAAGQELAQAKKQMTAVQKEQTKAARKAQDAAFKARKVAVKAQFRAEKLQAKAQALQAKAAKAPKDAALQAKAAAAAKQYEEAHEKALQLRAVAEEARAESYRLSSLAGISIRLRKDSIAKRFWKTRFLFVLFIPALVYYIMFKYVPMWGVRIAFYKYSIFRGFAGSKYVGLYHFKVFFNSPLLWRVTRNTLVLSFQDLLISFPTTILFSLMLNEMRSLKYKKVVQTVSYMPHFLSTVVVVSMITTLCDPTTGLINKLIVACGGDPIYFMTRTDWFRPLYLISGMWQGLGWGSIIYLAAISNVDPTLYEAARLDGAGRWRQMWNITLPAIAPTVSTMFILKIGHIMDASMEKCLLLGDAPILYEVSEVISTYTYRVGLGSGNYDMSTAVNLYSSAVNLVLILTANWISKKVTDSGIF